MFRLSALAIAVAAACWLSPAPARAEDPPADKAAEKASDSARSAELFGRLDKNGDGKVTADEVPEDSRRLFERLIRDADKNGDHVLTKDELTAGLADRPEVAPARDVKADRNVKAGAKALRASADSARRATACLPCWTPIMTARFRPAKSPVRPRRSRSSTRTATARSITKSSARRRVAKPVPADLAVLDRVVKGAEFMLERVKAMDKNGDGKISKEEAEGRFKERFDRIDANNDGFIDQVEVKQILERIREGRPGEGRPEGRPEGRRPDGQRPQGRGPVDGQKQGSGGGERPI